MAGGWSSLVSPSALVIAAVLVPAIKVSDQEADECILDEDVPLSSSYVFRATDNFYNNSVIERGERKVHVPFQVTSNRQIARKYARWTLGYLQDKHAQGELRSDEALHIFEAGGGNGQFTFYYLSSLVERWDAIEAVLPFRLVRYVFNDMDPGMVQFVRTHPALKHYVDAGTLHFLNAPLGVRPFSETRTDSGLGLGDSGNPAIFVANYFFDALRADVFRAKPDGSVQEVLFTNTFPCSKAMNASQSASDIDPFSDRVLSNIKHQRRFVTIEPSSRFSGVDAHMNYFLQWYSSHVSSPPPSLPPSSDALSVDPPHDKPPPPFRKTFAKPSPDDDPSSATFMLSVPGMRVLRSLEEGYRGGVLALVSDSGIEDVTMFRQAFNWEHVCTLRPPHGAKTPRRWTFTSLNLHALRLWAERAGGSALMGGVPEGDSTLMTAAFVIPASSREGAPSSAELGQCQSGGTGSGPGDSAGSSSCRGREYARLGREFADEVMMSHVAKLQDDVQGRMAGWEGQTVNHKGARARQRRVGEEAMDAVTKGSLFVGAMEWGLWDADHLFALRRVLLGLIRRLNSNYALSAALWRGLRRAEAGVYVRGDDVYQVIGSAYSMLGDPTGAVRALSLSLSSLGPHAVILLKRAQALKALGHTDDVDADYRAAAEWLTGQSCGGYKSGARGELETLPEVARGVRRKVEERAAAFGDEETTRYSQALAELEKCKT